MLDKPSQRLAGARPPHAATGNHHRTSRGPQQVHRARDVRDGGFRTHGQAAPRRAAFRREDVHGDGEMHRAFPAGIGDLVGPRR